jgi:Mn-dependent DtxR family transcriptional regulator
MPVNMGQHFLRRGSLPQAVMSYAVSEPGEWTARDIAFDISVTVYLVTETIGSLRRRKMLLISQKQIHPTEVGKQALFRSMNRR